MVVIVIAVGGAITFVALEDFVLQHSTDTPIIVAAIAIIIRMTTPLIAPSTMALFDPVLVLLVVSMQIKE